MMRPVGGGRAATWFTVVQGSARSRVVGAPGPFTSTSGPSWGREPLLNFGGMDVRLISPSEASCRLSGAKRGANIQAVTHRFLFKSTYQVVTQSEGKKKTGLRRTGAKKWWENTET